MQAIVNFLRGSILFTVTGAFPERFLNLCAQNGVVFWSLVWLDAHTLELRVARRDIRALTVLAEKVKCNLTPSRRAGVPYFLAQFKHRYALILGLILSLATVAVLSQFVLTIDVTGNSRVPTAAILSELGRQGVRLGVYSPGIDLKGVCLETILNIPDLAWMAINLHGTRAEVLVREKLVHPPVLDETIPAQVTSAATGIITRIELLNGEAQFEVGDTVLEGEVLISSVMNVREPQYGTVDMGTRTVHAQGWVYARTWRTLSAEIPLTAQVKVPTGSEKTRWSFTFLGKRLNFYGNSGFAMEKYDKITSVHSVTLPGGQVMPLALTSEVFRGYTTAPAAIDRTAAEELLKTRLDERLAALIGEGEVLKNSYTTREQEGKLVMTLLAECQEQIGREELLTGRTGRWIPGQPESTTTN